MTAVEIRKCGWCGEDFECALLGRGKGRPRKYCSEDCSRAALKEHQRQWFQRKQAKEKARTPWI